MYVLPYTNKEGLYWCSNNGDGSFAQPIIIPIDAYGTNDIKFIDMDQDGRKDIFVSATWRDFALGWFKNLGSANFSDRIRLNHQLGNVYTTGMADYDGDGDIDIAGGTSSSKFWLENDGSENFTYHMLGRISTQYSKLTFDGDINGDGDTDLFYVYDGALVCHENLSDYPTITGVTFFDENENGTLDETESLLRNITVNLLPNALSTYTDTEGAFQYFVSAGQYKLTTDSPLGWELTTDSSEYFIEISRSVALQKNFGFYPNFDKSLVDIRLTSSPTRCNSTSYFWLDYMNEGSQREDGQVSIILNGQISLLNTFPPANYISGDTLSWDYTDLMPTHSGRILFDVKIPGVEAIGDTISIKCLSLVEKEGLLQLSDSFDYHSEIRCAYDPNDKLVRPNRSNQYDKNYTLFEEMLEYTIRFQNTGNDTAFTVVIQDQLDEDLDWTTFKPLTASHDFETLLNKDGLVEFSFKNILLPDSIINEPLSHGFVSYQIKPKADLAENTFIENTASIYFDANPPIITNTTESILVSELPKTTSTQNLKIASDISFYPNPTNSLLYVKTEKNINELEIYLYSSVGKLARSYKAETILDVSNISTGIYFVEVRQNGTIISREKIIINN